MGQVGKGAFGGRGGKECSARGVHLRMLRIPGLFKIILIILISILGARESVFYSHVNADECGST